MISQVNLLLLLVIVTDLFPWLKIREMFYFIFSCLSFNFYSPISIMDTLDDLKFYTTSMHILGEKYYNQFASHTALSSSSETFNSSFCEWIHENAFSVICFAHRMRKWTLH